MSHRRLRDWHDLIAAHGVDIDRVERGLHFKFYCRHGDRAFVFTIAATPSDWRADLNNLSWLKKLAGLERPEKTAVERPRAPEARKPPPEEKRPVRPRPWPGKGIPQRIQNQARRIRLGLEGRRVPQAVLRLGRPILTLKGP